MPDLPLAEASRKLRANPPPGLRGLPRAVGRPRTWASDSDSSGPVTPETRATSGSAPRPGVQFSQVPMSGPRLLDLRQAATYLGVNPRTVRRLVEAGELRRVNAPVRRFLVDRADLDRVIESWKVA